MIAIYDAVYVSHSIPPIYIAYNTRKRKNHLSVNVMTNSNLEFISPTGEPFNFDLERMKKALESPSYSVPENLSFEEFDQWIHQIAQES